MTRPFVEVSLTIVLTKLDYQQLENVILFSLPYLLLVPSSILVPRSVLALRSSTGTKFGIGNVKFLLRMDIIALGYIV